MEPTLRIGVHLVESWHMRRVIRKSVTVRACRLLPVEESNLGLLVQNQWSCR